MGEEFRAVIICPYCNGNIKPFSHADFDYNSEFELECYHCKKEILVEAYQVTEYVFKKKPGAIEKSKKNAH